MPTTRPRHAVTETDEIAAILDEAARVWPGVSRSRLIGQVLADWSTGGRSITANTTAREALVGSLPGSSDLYDPRDDWPK